MMRSLAEYKRAALRAGRIYNAKRRLRNFDKLISVDFDGKGIGFFAQMNAIIKVSRYAVEHDAQPDLRLISENYLDSDKGPDWLEYFFEKIYTSSNAGIRNPIYIQDLSEFPVTYDDLPLKQANSLLFRFYRIRNHVQDSVQKFCSENNVGPHTLGIHYRGTDKSIEAPRVDADKAIESVLNYLRNNTKIKNIFVASDEQYFIHKAVSVFGAHRTVYLPDNLRSVDGSPTYLNKSVSGYLIGLDALLNCLVLSNCGILFRSSSFLSAWASIFCPEIEVILFNKPYPPYLWYPEREILKSAVLLNLS